MPYVSSLRSLERVDSRWSGVNVDGWYVRLPWLADEVGYSSCARERGDAACRFDGNGRCV